MGLRVFIVVRLIYGWLEAIGPSKWTAWIIDVVLLLQGYEIRQAQNLLPFQFFQATHLRQLPINSLLTAFENRALNLAATGSRGF